MTGRIFTADHQAYDLPALLEWNVTLTGAVPCDSFSVTFLYQKEMAEPLHLAAGFAAIENCVAGGTVTGWKNGPDCLVSGDVMASNGLMHDFFRDRLLLD